MCQLGIAQLLKVWNQIGHCHPPFESHADCHAGLGSEAYSDSAEIVSYFSSVILILLVAGRC